jgi:ABC-type transport system involved in multi-copper enzyme maturation permease subunit
MMVPESEGGHAPTESHARIVFQSCLGFLGPILAVALLIVGYIYVDVDPYNEVLYFGAPVITLILAVGFIVHFFRSGRRYVAIGMTVSLGLVFLCVLVLLVIAQLVANYLSQYW